MGEPIFPGLEKQFGWAGLGTLGVGILVGLVSLGLGMSGMEMNRLWFYYLASAGLCLVGVQLIIARIQIQALETLSQRAKLVASDLRGKDKVEVSRVKPEVKSSLAV